MKNATVETLTVVSRTSSPPLCVDCKHYRKGWFGRHLCLGYKDVDNVTGEVSVISDSCMSARSPVFVEPYYGTLVHGHGCSAVCGTEARLFEPRE